MVKKFLVFFIFLLALCSPALADVNQELYGIHESLVDVSYKYINSGDETVGFDSWISYDQTARFFCLTLEVSDKSEDLPGTDNGFDFDNPPTFSVKGGDYSYHDSYNMIKASTDMTFKLAPANSRYTYLGNDTNAYRRFGTDTLGYVPVNDIGNWVHFFLSADKGLNSVDITWQAGTSSEATTKTAKVPSFKSTEEQLADFVPYIEVQRDGGNVSGFKWRLVHSSDVSTAISLDKDIHIQIRECNNSRNQLFYSGDVMTFTSNDVVSGEVTFGESFDILELNCTVIRYYFEDEHEIYQWRFISDNVTDNDQIPYMMFTYGIDAGLTDGKSDYTYARGGNLDLGSIELEANPVEVEHLIEGKLTITGGNFYLEDGDGNLTEVASGETTTLPLVADAAGIGYRRVMFGPQKKGYQKANFNYILNNNYETRLIGFRDENGALSGQTVTWEFPGRPDANGTRTVPNYVPLQKQLSEGFFPYIELVSEDGKLTAVNYRIVKSPDLSLAYDPSVEGKTCAMNIKVSGVGKQVEFTNRFWDNLDTPVYNGASDPSELYAYDFKSSGTVKFNSDNEKLKNNGYNSTPALENLTEPIEITEPYMAVAVEVRVYGLSNTKENYTLLGNEDDAVPYLWNFTNTPPEAAMKAMSTTEISNVSSDSISEAVEGLESASDVKFLTDYTNIFEESEATKEAVDTLANDNNEMVGRFRQLYVTEPSWVATKITLPDEIFDKLKGFSTDNLRVYAIPSSGAQSAKLKEVNDSPKFFASLFKAAAAYADSQNIGRLVALDGSKVDAIDSKEFLMVSYLDTAYDKMNMYLGLDKDAEVTPAKEDEKVTYTLSVDVTPTTLSLSKGATSGNTLTAKTAISPDATITPTYQWYSNSANSTTGGSLINGATSATYLAPTTTAGTLYYYVIAKATVGSNDLTATSNVVSVTINASTTPAKEDEKVTYTLSVDVTPTTLSLSKGATSGNTLTAKTTISPDATITPTYQWYSNSANSTMGGTVISGATNATYLAPTTTAGTLYYYVIAKATVGSNDLTATSNVVSVTINAGTTPTESADVTEGITIGDSGAELDQTAVSEKVNELLKTKAQSEITLSDILGSDTAAIKTAIAASGGEFKLPNGVGNLSDLATLATNLGIKTLNITSTTTTLASISGLTGVNLEAINLESNTSVKTVSLVGATITTVTLTKSAVTSLTLGSGTSAANVKNVDANGATALEEVDIKGNTNITTLDIGNTAVTELDAENCTALTTLEVDNSSSNTQGELKNLSVKGCSNLTKLTISKNQLLWLDLSDTKMTRGANGGFSGRNQKRSAPNFKRKLNFFEFLWNLWAASLEGKTDYPGTYNEETSSPDIAPFKTSQIATTVSYTLSDDTTGTAEIDSNGTATLPAGTKSFKYYYNPFPTTAGTGGFTTADTADSSDMDVEITSTPLEEETYPSLGGSGGGCGSGFGIISALVLVLLKKRH